MVSVQRSILTGRSTARGKNLTARGESLELHLGKHPSPRLDYSHCRRAGRASGWQRNLSDIATTPCALAAAGVSAALCGLNCECCAEDTIDSAIAEGGTFHGTLLRSPRAFLLSLFTHCHTAHTSNSWSRIADDPPQVSRLRPTNLPTYLLAYELT